MWTSVISSVSLRVGLLGLEDNVFALNATLHLSSFYVIIHWYNSVFHAIEFCLELYGHLIKWSEHFRMNKKEFRVSVTSFR